MIIVRLKGGLGNQLFQYAFGYILSKKNKSDLKLDIEWFDTEGKVPWLKRRFYELDKFNIPSAEIIKHKDIPMIARFFGTRIVRRLLAVVKVDNIKIGNWLIVATTAAFNYMELPNSENILLNGYFDNHAAVYMKGYVEALRSEFKYKECSEETRRLLQRIKAEKNTTSIHIRRTDQMHDTGHKADLDYYERAIDFMLGKEPHTTFFMFSDDIEWCKAVFGEHENIVYATNREDSDTLGDFIGMMACQNNIIAYSTYSWWAAMLNENLEKIVIAPNFYDSVEFLPEDWIVL